MDAEPAENVVFHGHPSWRSMLGFHARWLLAAVVAGALVGAISAAPDRHVQAGWVAIVVFIVFAFGLIRGGLRRTATRYTITDRRLTIERGLLSREVHEAALARVQNVRCRQTLLQRMLGVGTVEFDTAGGAEYDFRLTGVEDPRRISRAVDRALNARGSAPATPATRI